MARKTSESAGKKKTTAKAGGNSGKKSTLKGGEKTAKKRLTFRFLEPSADEVSVVGEFNGWDAARHKMKKRDDGVWEKAVMVSAGRYEYKFVVNGQWQNDPANESLVPNEFGTMNNVVVV